MYDLYNRDNKNRYRFILGKSGCKKLFVIGLNPSTADKEKSDTTVAKVETVAKNNHYDGFIMANLYALRSTNPKGLPDAADDSLFVKNISQIISFAQQEEKPIFWAAWGGDIVSRDYLINACIELHNKVISKKSNASCCQGDIKPN